MSKLYLESGYVNAEWLYDQCVGFMDIVGGRGTGKTFGFLRTILNRNAKFIYLRRLQTQIELSTSTQGNPFKRVNDLEGWSIIPRRCGKLVEFCDYSVETEPKVKGYAMALSTVATIRGMDFSDVDVVLFDEFIKDPNERPIKNEFQLFLNFIETVSRNREMDGRVPLKVIMLANAHQLSNPYYLGWKFMKIAIRMIKGRQCMYRSKDGTRISVLLIDSPISRKKGDGALYKNASSDFIAMSLDNAFRVDGTSICHYKLRECSHVVSIGEIGIYLHRPSGDHFCCGTISKDCYFDGYGMAMKMFRAQFALLKPLYIHGGVRFESYEDELLFREYIGI